MSTLDEDVDEILCGFGEIPPDPPERRPTCSRCCRPLTVCWCSYLPREPLSIKTQITILQHPYEESRRLRTAPMLQYGLEPGQCKIIKGKKFNLKKHAYIQRLLQDPNTILMFPGPKAHDVASLPSGSDGRYNLLLLDGTWMQARGLFCQNPFMKHFKQVQLSSPGISEYVIRTQPTDGSLSTLETAVYAVAILENRPDIIQPLLNPLRAMCEFQMQHGAVKHHSKQYLIDRGLYKKQQPPEKRVCKTAQNTLLDNDKTFAQTDQKCLRLDCMSNQSELEGQTSNSGGSVCRSCDAVRENQSDKKDMCHCQCVSKMSDDVSVMHCSDDGS